MKSSNRIVQRWIFALTPLLSGVCCPAEAGQGSWAEVQQIPAAAVACYFVGEAFLNASGQGEVVGYFTDINGIGASDTLFNGTPSEQTAFFTFRSNVFSLTPLPLNGDIALDLTSAGTFNIYYNPTPNGDWSNPDTFSGRQKFPGQPIAQFTRPESLFVQILQSDVANPPPYESIAQHVLTETLVSSQSFTFNGTDMTSIPSCPLESHSMNCSAIRAFRGSQTQTFQWGSLLSEIASPYPARTRIGNSPRVKIRSLAIEDGPAPSAIHVTKLTGVAAKYCVGTFVY